MGRSAQPGIERRQQLLHILRSDSTVDTSDLASALGVSEMTVRRDLKLLENDNKVFRSYGGATLAHRLQLEFEFDESRQANLPAKRAIARRAAALVESNDTIFLDVGTTTLEFARELRRRDVPCTVATSSLAVASELWGHSHIRILMLGGQLKDGSPDLTGPLCEHSLELLKASKAFVGCDAIDLDQGYCAHDEEGARISSTMLRFASWTCILADASKLRQEASVRYADLGEVDLLVTDDGLPGEALDILRDAVREVQVVDVSLH